MVVVDVEGGGLGPAEDVARDHEQGAELAEGAGHGQGHAVGQAPADRGEGDPAEGPSSARRRGCPGDLLLIDAELAEHGHDLADDERHGHEHRGQDHPRPGVDRRGGRAPPRWPARPSPSGRRRSPASGRRRSARPRTAGRPGRRPGPCPRTAGGPGRGEAQAEEGVDHRRRRGDPQGQAERPDGHLGGAGRPRTAGTRRPTRRGPGPGSAPGSRARTSRPPIRRPGGVAPVAGWPGRVRLRVNGPASPPRAGGG